MAKNEIPEQKQDVFDPSKFKFIGASEGDEIFKEQGPEYFSKTERIVSYVLHGLFALAAIVLIVLGIYFGTESDYRFESWGIGAIVGIVLVGVVLLAAVVVSLLHHDFLSRGKANDILKRLARLYDVSLDFLLSEPSEEKGTTLSPRQAGKLIQAFRDMQQAFEEAGLSKGQESRSAEKRNECTDKCTIAEKTAVRKREKDN